MYSFKYKFKWCDWIVCFRKKFRIITYVLYAYDCRIQGAEAEQYAHIKVSP